MIPGLKHQAIGLLIVAISASPSIAADTLADSDTSPILPPSIFDPHKNLIERIPSILWPTYISVDADTACFSTGEKVPTDVRGVLQRCEGRHLVVDFGRFGVRTISPEKTNFYVQVMDLLKGEARKEHPNLTAQIGNKLMAFGPPHGVGPVKLEQMVDTRLYALVYLGDYTEATASQLMDLGRAYFQLLIQIPQIKCVILPKSKMYYDFAYTVILPVPFIAPYLCAGYIESLTHRTNDATSLVLVDSEGKILGRRDDISTEASLAQELEAALRELGIDWSYKPREMSTLPETADDATDATLP